MVLSRSGEGAGDAKFLLKCLALHPVCLKTFVVLKVSSSLVLYLTACLHIQYVLYQICALLYLIAPIRTYPYLYSITELCSTILDCTYSYIGRYTLPTRLVQFQLSSLAQ